MADLVEVFRDERGEWRWHRQAANGLIVATSGEGYIRHEYALEMATRLNAGCEVKDELEVMPEPTPAEESE